MPNCDGIDGWLIGILGRNIAPPKLSSLLRWIGGHEADGELDTGFYSLLAADGSLSFGSPVLMSPNSVGIRNVAIG